MVKKVLFLLFICSIIITGCQQNKSEYLQRAEESENTSLPIIREEELNTNMNNPELILNTKKNENVNCYELHVSNSKICGMIFLDKKMLLVDYKNGKIIIMDKQGDIMNQVGKLGSAPGEFQNPTGIAKSQQYIYILDDGNSRVQIMDYDLNYVKEIPIDKSELDSDIVFEDIAVDKNDNIYISGRFLINPGLLVINADTGKQSFQDFNFSGFLSENEGQVVGVSSGQLYLPNEDPVSFGIGTGQCSIIKCSLQESEKMNKFVGINTFTDFMFKKDILYCVSQYHNELQKFSQDGMYVESLGSLNHNAEVQYICTDDEGKIYVSENSDRIFVFEEK